MSSGLPNVRVRPPVGEVYFIRFSISVGLVGAAASVLHGWSAPALVKATVGPLEASQQPPQFPEAMSVLALAAKVGNALALASKTHDVERVEATDLAVLSEAGE
jgi:hypothetical protein